MKAYIYGVMLEGTPKEILEYQRLEGLGDKKQLAPWAPVYPPYSGYYEEIAGISFIPDTKAIKTARN